MRDPFGGSAEVWDGVPRLMIDRENLAEIMAYVPHYNGVIEGPVPLGGTEPIYLVVSRIFRSSLGEAVEVLYDSAEAVCESSGHPYDREAWSVRSVGGRSCS